MKKKHCFVYMWFSWRHIWCGTVDCVAFVYWFSSLFLDPSALEAFRIHSQDVQFACVAWCWWVVKLLLDIAVVKGKGKVTRRITSDGHCMCLCVCRLTTQTCGSYAKGSPLPNGVLLVFFFCTCRVLNCHWYRTMFLKGSLS